MVSYALSYEKDVPYQPFSPSRLHEAYYSLQTSPLSARHIAGVTLAGKPGVECARGRYLRDFTFFTSSISRHPKSTYVSQGL